METDKNDVENHSPKEHVAIRQTNRLTTSLTPKQLLTRLENIHRLGRKDVPQQ
jgi:hypothetical protein